MRNFFRFCVLFPLLISLSAAGLSVASGQDWEEEIEFVSRQQQRYQLKFAARPDATRFQLIRIPTAKWPNRETFFVKVGETTSDGQIRVDSFEERQAKNEQGIIVDVSRVGITFLKDGTTHTLVRNSVCAIPTYFAELIDLSDRKRKFYVKEGDEFVITKHPDVKFRLEKVKENVVGIHVLKEGRKTGEFEIDKK